MLQDHYSNQAKQFLRKSEKVLAKRIFNAIQDLRGTPFPTDVKRIEGTKEKLFRIRVGDFRILYEVDQNAGILGIVAIDKRSKVYD